MRAVAELVEQLPLQVITAESFDLLTGSPGARRQYLDWGVFHVEHRFFDQWQRFQRGIKQRNKLLRRGKISDQELVVWTRDLAASGMAITEYREAYFAQLLPRFKEIMTQLAPLGPVYQAGTLSGNPVAVAAGLTTLKILIRDDPYPRMEQLAIQLANGLNELATD